MGTKLTAADFETEMTSFEEAYQRGDGEKAVWYLLRANGVLGALCAGEVGFGVAELLNRVTVAYDKIVRGKFRLFAEVGS